MQGLNTDITNFARRHNLRRGVEAAAIIKATKTVLPKCLPPTIINDVIVESYANNTLSLSAPSGSALATLSFYRPKILVALNTTLGQPIIERVVTRARLDP